MPRRPEPELILEREYEPYDDAIRRAVEILLRVEKPKTEETDA